jgi:hypothetical protein
MYRHQHVSHIAMNLSTDAVESERAQNTNNPVRSTAPVNIALHTKQLALRNYFKLQVSDARYTKDRPAR